MYDNYPPAIEKPQWQSRKAQIEPPLIEGEWAFRIRAYVTDQEICYVLPSKPTVKLKQRQKLSVREDVVNQVVLYINNRVHIIFYQIDEYMYMKVCNTEM